MYQLSRLTTEFIAEEDRIRLTGQIENGSPMVLWLTQRLINRLLPVLTKWLEEKNVDAPRNDIVQSFAQQSARAELAPQAPVVSKPESLTWLIQTVDVTTSKEIIRLVLKNKAGEASAIQFSPKQIRQWLNIVFDAYQKGGWSVTYWPTWLSEGALPPQRSSTVLH